jgi:CheY-like chemotaxis protein
LTTDISSIKNILLVKDDPREVELTLAARGEEYLAEKVAIVGNGAEALDYLYRRGKFEMRPGGNPILVLLDLDLAEVNNLEELEIIKADAHLKIIPVVALSSSCETPESPAKHDHWINAHVPKPVDLAGFIKSIEQLGPFWAGVDEPPPPVSRNVTASYPIYGKGRTPNSHGKISAVKFGL